jgi:hypothetical protein
LAGFTSVADKFNSIKEMTNLQLMEVLHEHKTVDLYMDIKVCVTFNLLICYFEFGLICLILITCRHQFSSFQRIRVKRIPCLPFLILETLPFTATFHPNQVMSKLSQKLICTTVTKFRFLRLKRCSPRMT